MTATSPQAPSRVRILSRSSDLALTQARLVARALTSKFPGLTVEHLTRQSLGDRDGTTPLSAGTDKGLFTADLSDALVAGDADLVVHSWKDLPIELRPDTVVAGTLPRGDVRDVLLVRREAVTTRPQQLSVLTSSPRRAWQLSQGLAPLLPWGVEGITALPVRGNIPTRLATLAAGHAHALVVAKAALDRLLDDRVSGATRDHVRNVLDRCRWMVLPIREFPAAPAQGALAIEAARHRAEIIAMVEGISDEATRRACERERDMLRAYGGGCHEAVGITVLEREYGTITSARGRPGSGDPIEIWRLESFRSAPPQTSLNAIYPRPDERAKVERRPVPTTLSIDADAVWVTRADAWPDASPDVSDRLVWASGTRTWRKLAGRGVWVNGCADGLGDAEDPHVDSLSDRRVPWHRLTHTISGIEHATVTYEVSQPLPRDLETRTHFYWTSGSHFLRAIDASPAIRTQWHASGPGRTARTIASALETHDRTSIWLDYDDWLETVTRP